MSTQVGLLTQWRDLMRSWGFTVLETAGWQTRDAEPGTSYDPSRMFLEHHDASTPLSGNWGALAYVTNNKLSQLVYSRDGEAMLVAAGVTWHAGVGGPFADIPANQGNRYSLAVEVANSGSEAYSPALTRLIIAGEAAWCRVMKRQADRVRGHKEWATPAGRKTDPSIDMNQRRASVAAMLANQGDDMFSDNDRLLLTNVYVGMYFGGQSTPQKKSLFQLVAELPGAIWQMPVDRSTGDQKVLVPALQELADTKSAVLRLEGRPVDMVDEAKLAEQLAEHMGSPDVDETALAAMLSGTLTQAVKENLTALSREQVTELAQAFQNEADRRARDGNPATGPLT